MRVIVIRNAKNVYVDLERIESVKYGIERIIEPSYQQWLSDYDNVVKALKCPDHKLYQLVGDAFESESVPDTSDNVALFVDRLVNVTLSDSDVIIWPVERFSDMLARSLHKYAISGGKVPAIHYYMDWLITDQNLLADIIQAKTNKVILYDVQTDNVIESWPEACIYSSKLYALVASEFS